MLFPGQLNNGYRPKVVLYLLLLTRCRSSHLSRLWIDVRVYRRFAQDDLSRRFKHRGYLHIHDIELSPPLFGSFPKRDMQTLFNWSSIIVCVFKQMNYMHQKFLERRKLSWSILAIKHSPRYRDGQLLRKALVCIHHSLHSSYFWRCVQNRHYIHGKSRRILKLRGTLLTTMASTMLK